MGKPHEVLHVLIIEGSPLSRKLVEHTLADSSCKLEFAKDGREAMGTFGRKPPDIVITDWELPDTTGPQLCRRIRRQDSQGTYTYILLLNSNADQKSLAEGLSSGADDYVTKPFDREALRARVGVSRRVVELYRELESRAKRLLLEARTDPLTGLPNRRAVGEWATRQLACATRHGFPLWIVLAELESHRTVNDLLGCAAGDAMLRAFADVLRKCIRVSDMFGHLGGAQFILVLSHIEQDNIELLLDRLRTMLAARPYTLDRSTTPLTVTFGAAASTKNDPVDFLSLMRNADSALVEARRVAREAALVNG